MLRIKILFSIIIFSFLLVFTSIIKNKTREIEMNQKEKDLNESQLDLSYLTSPAMIEKSLKNLEVENYLPMEFSKIFLSIFEFKSIQNKFVNQENKNEKKIK